MKNGMHYNKLTAVKSLVLMLVSASERHECHYGNDT